MATGTNSAGPMGVRSSATRCAVYVVLLLLNLTLDGTLRVVLVALGLVMLAISILDLVRAIKEE